MIGFARFYFVTHSPDSSLAKISKESTDSSFISWDAEELARKTVRNGLAGWLIDKAS